MTKLLDEEAQQRKALSEVRRAGGGGAAPTASRDQMRALRQKTDEGAKTLLSAEQYTQFEAMRAEERGGGRERGGNREAGGANPGGPGRAP